MSAATLTELKAACQGASGDFLVQQLEAGATVQSALQAHNAQLRAELANRPAQQPGKPGGVRPTQGSGTAGELESSTEDFEQLVSDFRQRNPNMDRLDAVASVARKHPQAHADFVIASQSGGAARRLASTKFADLAD